MEEVNLDRFDLGRFVLLGKEDETWLYPVGFLPADREGNWRPVSAPGHFREWTREQWERFKEAVAQLDAGLTAELEQVRLLVSEASVARVTKIEIRSAGAVFGQKAARPDRPVAIVWTGDGARLVLTVPLGARYEGGKWVIFDQALFRKSTERSRFGAFLRRYGKPPEVGMLVKTCLGERGYWTIEC